MNPALILGVLLAFAVAGDVGLGWSLHGANVTIGALKDKITEITGERDAQALGLRSCQNITSRQQDQIDAGDKAARAAAAKQQADAQTLASRNSALEVENNQLFTSYQEALNARPSRVTIQQVYPEGWDPVVAAAAQYIRGLQLSFASGAAHAANGGVQGSVDPGGPGAPRATPSAGLASVADAGAEEARPSAQQQLDFMNDYSKLWYWGAKCYEAKAAIAASQNTGDVGGADPKP